MSEQSERATEQEDEFPEFHLGDDGRPSRMETPPGAELAGDDVITEPTSKRVMLRAEHKDEIEITQVVHGMTSVPKTYTVLERRQTYYGPSIKMYVGDRPNGGMYQLTCPGPNTQLILWRALHDEEGAWNGFIPISEVKAKIADTTQYNICDVCNRPLRGKWHRRLSVFGLCEDHEDVNDLSGEI